MDDQRQQLLQNRFFDQGADSVYNDLYGELWKACADPLMCVPTTGERVYYFPRLHIDQLDNSTNLEVIDQVQISNLPPKILCRLIHVRLLADHDTDEGYAEILLRPEQDQTEVKTFDHRRPDPPRPQFHSFSKVLTTSDAHSNWGLCVHQRDAISCFPPLDTSQKQPSQELIARDIHGIDWRFQHVFRGLPPRHLLTKGWKAFVKSKRLVAGDSVVFIRGENGKLLVGVRRLVYQQSCGGLSRACSQTKQVLGAVISHALLTQTRFTVYYESRTSQSIISLNKYLQSVDYYEGYQHRSVGSDEQMEEVDCPICPLPQPTTISSEVDWEGLDDILQSPDPLELDTGESGDRYNNLANQDIAEREEEEGEDPSPILQQNAEEESSMRAIPIAILQEGSSQVMHISSIPSQIPYCGHGRGDEKVPWEGYFVAQRCIPTLDRIILRYPDSLSGFKPWSNAVKTMFLEILAEVVYLLEHFTLESPGRSRDRFDMAKQFLWDMKHSGIDVSWAETRVVQIEEALKMQSLIQQKKELVLKFEEARSALGKVNKQLEELSSKVGPNHLVTDKPILES